MMTIERLLPLLRCPVTGERLSVVSETLLTNQSGRLYPIIKGKPILVANVQPIHITPPDARIVSQNTDTWAPDADLPAEGVAINLGSGNVPSADPRVISIDVLPNTNVDLVCEAEALPFADDSIDLVASGAVFEHVHNPLKAASESRRILKVGGKLRIDTAFLQGYHGFPGHYFNMTPQACETFLLDDLRLVRSYTSDASIFHPVVNGLTFLLEQLPEAEREAFKKVTVGDAMQAMHEKVPIPWQGRVTEMMRRTYAAQFVVEGIKTASQKAERPNGPRWDATKRDYYAARMGVIVEYDGIGYFRMRAVEDFGVDAATAKTPPALDDILFQHVVRNTLDPGEWEVRTQGLNAARNELRELRDVWTRAFLTEQARKSAA